MALTRGQEREISSTLGLITDSFLRPLPTIGYDRTVKSNVIVVPMGACPYNPPVIPTSPVTLLSIDTGPLGVCQALPCFAGRRRHRCR